MPCAAAVYAYGKASSRDVVDATRYAMLFIIYFDMPYADILPLCHAITPR